MVAPEISLDADIKPLFREKDRNSMRRAFDLWSYADVRTHAAANRRYSFIDRPVAELAQPNPS
jgi:hypothetical protein